ncbi:transglycosylase domain-containing protein [Scytonema sp. NUACC26]|uniref:transglycosylase domain-containing protein n=1 Tax=Scytonema sp. NUACC26 TaxID=3140176 RepID=UPI0034DCB394
MTSLAQWLRAFLRWVESLLPPQVQQTSQTIGNNISRVLTTLFEQFPQLRPNARVPKLKVRDPVVQKVKEYPLLHSRFVLGRDRRVCDIVTPSPIVSKEHLSIERRNDLPNKPFVIQDRGSKHGIYKGKKQIKELVLRHGDVLTLGIPELANSVQIEYLNPPPLYITAAYYSFYGIICIPVLFLTLSVLAYVLCPAVNPLPVLSRQPVIVYASNQVPLYLPRNVIHEEAENLSQFPTFLPQAAIASEDSRYYWHIGIDPIGIARAILINLQGGGISEGASTLTQQVARTLFSNYVGREQSLFRKFKEAAVALKLETVYSKDFILLNYLNNVYLGEGVYGFKDAAKVYFRKPVKDLTLSEAATLVAMLPGPNGFDLCRNQDDASHKDLVERRNRVINRMLDQYKITSDKARLAMRSTIQAAPSFCKNAENRKAPYFGDYVFQELQTLLGKEVAQQGNYIIVTSLNLEMQEKAENALENTMNNEGASKGFSQGAIATIDPNTGRILALVGGVDYQVSQLNRVQTKRQPGSTFKVFAYAAALEQGVSTKKTYSCQKFDWDQESFPSCQYTKQDKLDMYDSIALSENVIALQIAREAGIGNVVEIAQQMGIKSKLKPVPRLVLGHSEVNLLELTGAYGVLANEGTRTRTHAIKRIFDSSSCKNIQNFSTCDRVIYSDDRESERRVLKEGVASTMTKLLRGVVQREDGTGHKANLAGIEVAGKTGTTNDYRDLWFVGYIPKQFVTGVWLGNDDNTPTSGTSALAAKLWGDYMSRIAR